MYRAKRFDTFKDFVEFNKDYIESNPLQNIFLIKVITAIISGQITALDFFNIMRSNGNRIVCLIVDDTCLIYTDSYDDKSLNLLTEELEFHRFNKYAFAGNKDLVENLLITNGAKYSVGKHLCIYKCNALNTNLKISSGKIRLASMGELGILTSYGVDFTQEYDGNIQSFDYMKAVIGNAILEQKLFVWEDNQICSMAMVIKRDELNFPEIGHVYTPPEFRSKGYSKSLIHTLTGELLEEFEYSMLYTHGHNTSANKVFVNVGYFKTGDYVRCLKEI